MQRPASFLVLETRQILILILREPYIDRADLPIPGGYLLSSAAITPTSSIATRSIRVEDLESRNGVIVNGRKLDPHSPTALSDGDAIRIGDQMAVFLDISAQEDSQRLSTIHLDH